MPALYRFGHGLSYTAWAYANLRVAPRAAPPGVDRVVTVDVTNTGRRVASDHAVLVFATPPPGSGDDAPVRVLAGFAKLKGVAPGATATARVRVAAAAFAHALGGAAQKRPVVGAWRVRVGGGAEEEGGAGEVVATLCVGGACGGV